MTATLDRLDPDAVAAWKAERTAAYSRIDELERTTTGRPLTPDEVAEHARLKAAVDVSLCGWLGMTRRNG